MVRGEHLVEAVWARDWSTLWHALKRLMIPLYIQSNKIAIGIFFAVLFLLFMPFPILAYSVLFFNVSESFIILCGISLISVGFFYLGSIMDAKKGLSLGFRHALFAPIGSAVISSWIWNRDFACQKKQCFDLEG